MVVCIGVLWCGYIIISVEIWYKGVVYNDSMRFGVCVCVCFCVILENNYFF